MKNKQTDPKKQVVVSIEDMIQGQLDLQEVRIELSTILCGLVGRKRANEIDQEILKCVLYTHEE